MRMTTDHRVSATDLPVGYILGFVSIALVIVLVQLSPSMRTNVSNLHDYSVLRSLYGLAWPHYAPKMAALLTESADWGRRFARAGSANDLPPYAQPLLLLSVLLSVCMGSVFLGSALRRLALRVRSPIVRPSTLYGFLIMGVWVVISGPVAWTSKAGVDERLGQHEPPFLLLEGTLRAHVLDAREYSVLPAASGGGSGSFHGFQPSHPIPGNIEAAVEVIGRGDSVRITISPGPASARLATVLLTMDDLHTPTWQQLDEFAFLYKHNRIRYLY